VKSQNRVFQNHNVKIEQSARGSRISVDANANKYYEAMKQAISLYRSTKLSLENLNEMVAPIEVKV
jgi:hypothetical protein